MCNVQYWQCVMYNTASIASVKSQSDVVSKKLVCRESGRSNISGVIQNLAHCRVFVDCSYICFIVLITFSVSQVFVILSFCYSNIVWRKFQA